MRRVTAHRGMRRDASSRVVRSWPSPRADDSRGTVPAADATLTIWVGWSAGRELDVVEEGRSRSTTRKHPERDRRRLGGIDDDKIVAAIRSGDAPDIVSRSSRTNVGNYCSSGRLDRPGAVPEAATTSTSTISRPRRGTTRSTGASAARCRCSPTWRASTTTRCCSRRRASSGPPRTMLGADRRREEADAARTGRLAEGRRLRLVHAASTTVQRRADGSRCSAASGHDANGQVDPGQGSGAGRRCCAWQKSLVDFYGYDKLVRFQDGLGDEYSASNAFEVGKLAMNLDGEWRVAFIKAEHPDSVRHGADARRRAHPELYGSSVMNGSDRRDSEDGGAQGRAWKLAPAT